MILTASHKPAADICIGFLLLHIRKRLQLPVSIMTLKRRRNQPVADLRILRKERPVQIRADYIFIQNALWLSLSQLFHNHLETFIVSVKCTFNGSQKNWLFLSSFFAHNDIICLFKLFILFPNFLKSVLMATWNGIYLIGFNVPKLLVLLSSNLRVEPAFLANSIINYRIMEF